MSGNLALKEQLLKFTPMQQKAFKYLFDPSIKGDIRKAMTAAGYSANTDPYVVLGPMRDLIIEASKDYLMYNAGAAVMNLVGVIEKPDELGNNIRLKAIETLLDRVGMGKEQKIEHTGTINAVLVLPPKDPVKLTSEPIEADYSEVEHKSDCAVHNGPAYEPGECDCQELRNQQLVEAKEAYWKNPDKDND